MYPHSSESLLAPSRISGNLKEVPCLIYLNAILVPSTQSTSLAARASFSSHLKIKRERIKFSPRPFDPNHVRRRQRLLRRSPEETLLVKRMSEFATLPVRGSPQAAGLTWRRRTTSSCPLAARPSQRRTRHEDSPTCYGRIAQRRRLAWKSTSMLGLGSSTPTTAAMSGLCCSITARTT